jgi:hypothetical protein
VLIYQALKLELAPMKPLAKFICVKSVVFFSWYQSFFLGLAVHFGWVPAKDEKGHDYALILQNFLICIEMFLAALVHHHVFPSNADYLLVGAESESIPIIPQDARDSQGNWKHGLKAMFYVNDIAVDAKNVSDDLQASLIQKAKQTSRTVVPKSSKDRPKNSPRTVEVV